MALLAYVRRLQHAVGHGGFHSGFLCVRDMRPSLPEWVGDISYVYDCGSEQKDAFGAAMAMHRHYNAGRTHYLFVSHLHADHINGIERLQGMAPADTVVLPYLDVLDRVTFVLSDISTGRHSSSGMEYFSDPVGWWRRRGATSVVFIEPDRPPDEGAASQPWSVPPAGGEDRPSSTVEEQPGQPGRREKRARMRLGQHLARPLARVPRGMTPADPSRRDAHPGAVLAGIGSSFLLEYLDVSGAAWLDADWVLLPYVHPVDATTREAFRRAVRLLLGVGQARDADLQAALLAALADYAMTKNLVALYREHFRRGQNALSMSLYSGPFQNTFYGNLAPPRWELIARPDGLPAYVPSPGWGTAAVGWLSTGDAALKERLRREPLLNFYSPVWSEVMTLTLPHHGSARNFHADLLQFPHLRVALATTLEHAERVAQLHDVLNDVESMGVLPLVVDDQRRNRFALICERLLAR